MNYYSNEIYVLGLWSRVVLSLTSMRGGPMVCLSVVFEMKNAFVISLDHKFNF